MNENECFSCGEDYPRNDCPKSERDCGHHCNCLDLHDVCDWCGATISEDGESIITGEASARRG